MITEVKTSLPIGTPGDLDDNFTAMSGDVVSRTLESGPISFGTMCAKGTGDRQIAPLAAQADKLAGILVRAHHYANPEEVDDDALLAGVTGGVLRVGRIKVFAVGAVTPEDEVHVQCIASSGHPVGSFRADAEADKTLDCSAFAEWVTSGEDDVVVLDLDMRNAPLGTVDS